MPGPGRGGGGFGRRGGGGPGFVGGRGFGWGPAPGPRPGPVFRGPGPLGVIGAVATGAVIASVIGPPPRRRYTPPLAGYIYVAQQGHGGVPRAVRMEDGPFLIMRVAIDAFRNGEGGEVLFEVQVTMNDGYKYGVLRRYSAFHQLRERLATVVRTVTPPFPPKSNVRSATLGLRPADLEARRKMLHAWLQSLCSAACNSLPLRGPMYDFLETAAYYPPEAAPVTGATAAGGGAAAAAAAAGATTTAYATATPYAEALPAAAAAGGGGGGGAGAATAFASPLPPEVPVMAKPDPSARGRGDGWAVPTESREASDLKLAMAGPDANGRLTGAQAAEALRTGTGAGSEDLRAVWELSDIDKDGMLDREEFAVAWYLAHQAAAGNKPPATLPADVVPPSKRTAAAPRSAANPF